MYRKKHDGYRHEISPCTNTAARAGLFLVDPMLLCLAKTQSNTATRQVHKNKHTQQKKALVIHLIVLLALSMVSACTTLKNKNPQKNTHQQKKTGEVLDPEETETETETDAKNIPKCYVCLAYISEKDLSLIHI